jgi:hypothetical protein
MHPIEIYPDPVLAPSWQTSCQNASANGGSCAIGRDRCISKGISQLSSSARINRPSPRSCSDTLVRYAAVLIPALFQGRNTGDARHMFDGGRSATDDGQTGLVGLVLLLGVDRFLNEARAVTNLIGNGIGTIAIAKWDGAFDQAAANREIAAMKNPQAAPPTPIVKADTLP